MGFTEKALGGKLKRRRVKIIPRRRHSSRLRGFVDRYGVDLNSTIRFDSIINNNKDMVFNLLYRLTGDFHLAEDLFQEVFLRVYRQFSAFRGKSRLSTWVYSIAVNVYREYCRKKRHSGLADGILSETIDMLPDSSPTPEELLIQRREKESLQKILDSMKHRLKIPTVLYYIEGLPIKDISSITGRTETDIKVSLYRARKYLKKRYSHPG
jgi:RNA polymerase sigma-70 factor (ECF subfamily)